MVQDKLLKEHIRPLFDTGFFVILWNDYSKTRKLEVCPSFTEAQRPVFVIIRCF